MKCKQGDLATIIQSVDGASVGMIVQCVRYMGDHSLYGPVWRVRANNIIVTEYGGVSQEADVPDKWLKPIKPGDLEEKKDLAKLNASDSVKELLSSIEDVR